MGSTYSVPSKKRISILYFWSFVTLGLTTGLLGPSLPSFASNTGSTLRQLSNLFLLSSLGYMLGSFGVGLYVNKVKGHLVLALSLTFIALFVALLPIIKSLWLLVAIFFLLGIAQSHLDVAENMLLIWLHGSQVASYMNSLHFFFGFGTLIAPLLIAQSLRLNNSITGAFWLMAVLMVLPAPFLLRQRSPTEPVLKSDQEQIHTQKSSILLVMFLVGMFMGFVGAEVTFGGWVYTYSLDLGMTTVQTAAYLVAVYWTTFTLARLLGIVITRWISIRTLMWIDLLGSLLGICAMLIRPNSVTLLWLTTFVFGFFIATSFPVGMNLAEKLGVISAKVTSWFLIAASLTSMISPWIVGQFFESWSPLIVLWVVLVNLAIAILFYMLISMRIKALKTAS
ncbi:MAG: hypothetical protein BGO78_10855 [Chloroflexi bacterium 44-23]|nr:MAG: hypothetical protein BGO78_10855 [Chloroflexi bacterium 44-23]